MFFILLEVKAGLRVDRMSFHLCPVSEMLCQYIIEMKPKHVWNLSYLIHIVEFHIHIPSCFAWEYTTISYKCLTKLSCMICILTLLNVGCVLYAASVLI